MDARSALFDLYGDHLRSRGGRAPVAALIRLLGALDVAAPAVRTAVSRMVRQGWLAPERVAGAPGYALTPRARQRLDEAAIRIYRTGSTDWDRTWHVLVLTEPVRGAARGRVARGLRYLGYAPVGDRAWLAPRHAPEVVGVLAGEGVRAEAFTARHEPATASLARRSWDLDALGQAYAAWIGQAHTLLEDLPPDADDATAFATRSRLVHGWRKFMFTDPGLPRELLQAPWPGDDAGALFDREQQRLAPAAARFVDACLDLRPPAIPNGAAP